MKFVKKGEKTKARNWHLNTTLSYQLSSVNGKTMENMSETIFSDPKILAHNKSLQLIEPYRFAPIHLHSLSIGFCWCLSSGRELLEL